MDYAIATRGLSRRFGRTEAVADLTLQVPTGSVFALVGPNGAGKTTTIKALMNLLTPSAGSASVLGVDSRRLGPATLARIGYVSENQELPAWMTIAQLVDYCRPFYPTWDATLAGDLARQLDLPLDRPIRACSRGMAMKAALLVSLAYRPELLVMDEPFRGPRRARGHDGLLAHPTDSPAPAPGEQGHEGLAPRRRGPLAGDLHRPGGPRLFSSGRRARRLRGGSCCHAPSLRKCWSG